MSDISSQEPFRPVVVALRDGRQITLRPVRPDDQEAMRAALGRLSGEARYTRFMAAMNKLPPGMLERAVRPAPDRELALVAVAGQGADAVIVGGCRYYVEADPEACEFAITVADEWRGAGLASRMLRELIGAARARGLKRMDGYVLAENRPMLDLARRLGFEVTSSTDWPNARLVRLKLDSDPNAAGEADATHAPGRGDRR